MNIDFSGVPKVAAAYARNPRNAVEDFAGLLSRFHKIFRVYLDSDPPPGRGKWAIVLNMKRQDADIALKGLRADVETFAKSVKFARTKCAEVLTAIDLDCLNDWYEWLFIASIRFVERVRRLKDSDSRQAEQLESIELWFRVEENFRTTCECLGFELSFKDSGSGIALDSHAVTTRKMREKTDIAKRPKLNSLMVDLLQKHGQETCVAWSAESWAVQLIPQWGSKPSKSSIAKTGTWQLIKELRKQAGTNLIDRQTMKDKQGKRRPRTF